MDPDSLRGQFAEVTMRGKGERSEMLFSYIGPDTPVLPSYLLRATLRSPQISHTASVPPTPDFRNWFAQISQRPARCSWEEDGEVHVNCIFSFQCSEGGNEHE